MKAFWFFVFQILAIFTQSNGAHREHKVHNIVLYPDKHSWCQTQQIKQVISYPGCISEEIDNNVCVGACFSYSIPHTEPSDPGEVIVPYCDSCQPSDTTWLHITLQCEKNSDKTPPQLVKRVQIINNCSCSSCEGDHNRYKSSFGNDIDESDDSFMMQQNDIPDLLRLMNSRNESSAGSSSVHAENMKSLMNHKIVTLLKDIQEKNSRYDKDQLTELLKTIQGPEHQKVNDEKIADFVESLNSENVELDLVRLREVLSKFEHSKYFEKHRKYTLGNHVASADSNELEGEQRKQHRHHHHSHQLVSTDSEEKQDELDSSKIDTLTNTALDHISHHKNQQADDKVDEGPSVDVEESINPLSKRHQTEDVVVDSILKHHKNAANSATAETTIVHHQVPHHHHHLHQHHHVGEEIIGHGHLTQGPNGALVIEPDRIHEKLDVNPHELKPNHAGTFLSYSGQPTIEKPKTKSSDSSEDD